MVSDREKLRQAIEEFRSTRNIDALSDAEVTEMLAKFQMLRELLAARSVIDKIQAVLTPSPARKLPSNDLRYIWSIAVIFFIVGTGLVMLMTEQWSLVFLVGAVCLAAATMLSAFRTPQ